MTYFHYYASTSRNLDRAVQYGLYPIAQIVGFGIARKIFTDKSKCYQVATDIARFVSAGAYSALTSFFYMVESETIDANTRQAVSAELGIDYDKLKFSDLKTSHNVIASRAYDDIKRLQKYRFGTDLMFILPWAMREGMERFNGYKWLPQKYIRDELRREPSLERTHSDSLLPTTHSTITFKDFLINGTPAWDYGVYASKALYWAGETYMVPKTSNYEIDKIRENLTATGKDPSWNDMLAVYQRARQDRGLHMIRTHEEYDALRPILKKLAEEYNKHDKIGISEIVYLIGSEKINIHGADHKTLSQKAVDESHAAIDHLLEVGLEGIREENRVLRQQLGGEAMTNGRKKGFTDRLMDGAFQLSQSIGGDWLKRVRPEEYISARDAGEQTASHYGGGAAR